MDIVAGLGCIDDYVRLVKAGADEVFCGYVPYEWNKKYGNLFPLNRREVLYYNAQINSMSDMKILKKMVDMYKVPVNITFNYLYYVEEQYEEVASIIKELLEIGFKDFIIADIGLLLYLNKKNIKCDVHLSGECAEINRLSMKFLKDLHISRFIFHRKNTIDDMKSCIDANENDNLEYEAFILNERCHYTGAFCESLHCDELAHLCKMPYHMGKVDEFSHRFKDVDEKFEKYYENEYFDDCDDLQLSDEKENSLKEKNCDDDCNNECDDDILRYYKLGSTGCGLCALKKLKEAGITHLKVVGRGNHIDYMVQDVKNLRKALDMLEKGQYSNSYEKSVKDKLFHGRCSGECYYLNQNK